VRRLKGALGLAIAVLLGAYVVLIADQSILLPREFTSGCIAVPEQDVRWILRPTTASIEAICRYRFLEFAKTPGRFRPNTAIGVIVASYPDLSIDEAADLIAELQERGVDVNEYSAIGTTPLHQAVMQNEAAMVRLLLQLGADAHASRKHVEGMTAVPTEGMTALEMAIWIRENGRRTEVDPEVINALQVGGSSARSN
jgi:Ankyrin repeats (3 copies)